MSLVVAFAWILKKKKNEAKEENLKKLVLRRKKPKHCPFQCLREANSVLQKRQILFD